MAKSKKNANKPKKKKIGWWKFIARWVFSPLLSTGREAVKEAIPDEHAPLEDLAVLAIDISEDMVNIHTDMEPDNKKQVSDWWKENNPRIITTSLNVIMYAGQLAIDKMSKGEPLNEEEKKNYRLYKAIKEVH